MTYGAAGQASGSRRPSRSARSSGSTRPRQAELEVLALSDTEWRISDPARAAQDGIPLVGFITRVEDMFEVTQLGSPHEHLRFDSLAMAVSYLSWPSAGSA